MILDEVGAVECMACVCHKDEATEFCLGLLHYRSTPTTAGSQTKVKQKKKKEERTHA